MTDETTMPPAPARLGWFWRAIEIAMVTAFVGMLLAMLIQVVSRQVFQIGVPWTDETSRFLYVAQIFLGAAIAQRYGEHIRITILLDAISPKPRRLFESLGDILSIAICSAVVAGSLKMIVSTANTRASTLPIPIATLYAVQAFGLTMLIVLIARDMAIRMRSPSREGAAT